MRKIFGQVIKMKKLRATKLLRFLSFAIIILILCIAYAVTSLGDQATTFLSLKYQGWRVSCNPPFVLYYQLCLEQLFQKQPFRFSFRFSPVLRPEPKKLIKLGLFFKTLLESKTIRIERQNIQSIKGLRVYKKNLRFLFLYLENWSHLHL